MPVITSAGSDSETSHISGHLHGGQSLVHRLSILVGAATAIIAASLFQRFVLSWLSRRHSQHRIRGSLLTGASASKLPPNLQSLPDSSWLPAGQGPGQFEKRSTWVISRGEASGTAPVGAVGSVEGSSSHSMEEKERTTPTGDRSRGVSTFLSPGATQESSGLSYLSQTFPAAASAADEEESDHVRIPSSSRSPSPLGHAGGVSAGSCGKQKDSMDDDYSGRLSGHVSVVATSRSTTPFFGQPEDIIDGTAGSVPAIGGGPSWRRRLELNFARPPPPPTLAENPVYFAPPASLEAQWSPETYAQSVPAGLGTIGADITRPADGQRPNPDYAAAGPLSGAGAIPDSPSLSVSRRINYTKGHHIPARTTPGMQENQETGGQVIDASRGVQFTPTHSLTSSSYPSTSPLLPPPPPTLDHRFDLGDIMFPGAGAVDGGVRVVPAGPIHNHSEGGTMDGHGELASAFDDSAAGWKRHTRVYGGGVCLACAAAGGGGFYGARVRPEDKR